MRDLALLFQKPEMCQHRMIVREIELADDAHRVMPGLDARELDALLGVKQFATRQLREKVKMPPGAAEFAVGRKLQSDRGLLVHDLLDLHVLDLAQIVGGNLALLQSGARLLDARRPQQAANLVGAEGGFCSLHGFLLAEEFRSHCGMVRRTRPGSSRFRVRANARPGMTKKNHRPSWR